MAKFVNRNVSITIGNIPYGGGGTIPVTAGVNGGVDISGYANKCEITDEADKVEFTGFSSAGYKEFGQGLHDATISLTVFNDFYGTATPYGQLQPMYQSGSAYPITILPNGSTVGTANPRISMIGRIYAFSPLQGGIGDASSFDVSFANAGTAGLQYATA